jgi:hypothetical protein
MGTHYTDSGFITSNHMDYPLRQLNVPSRDYSQSSVLKLSHPSFTGNKAVGSSYARHTTEYTNSYIPAQGSTVTPRVIKPNEDHMKTKNAPSNDYVTTSMSAYIEREKTDNIHQPSRKLKERLTNIAFGDRKMVNQKTSNHQHSYSIIKSKDKSQTYDKDKALEQIYGSSIKLGDGETIYQSLKQLYPLHDKPEKRAPIDLDQNVSSFPKGDTNPRSNKERLTKQVYLKVLYNIVNV